MLQIKQLFVLLAILIAFEGCDDEPVIRPGDDKDSLDTIEIDSSLIYPNCIAYADPEWTGGCENMFFYKALIEDSIYFVVRINSETVLVVNECQEYNLPSRGVSLSLEVSKGYADSIYFNYCNDLRFKEESVPYQYPISSGKLTIAASIDTVHPDSRDFFISAEFTDCVFKMDQMDTLISQVIFYKKKQGWSPG